MLAWEWQLGDVEWQAGSNGAGNDGAVAGCVVGGGDEGDSDSTLSEKLGEVYHGDHVALGEEREEKDVRGGHGREVSRKKTTVGTRKTGELCFRLYTERTIAGRYDVWFSFI